MISRPGEAITHTTRGQSLESVDRKRRYQQIIDILRDNGSMTAKEIAVAMHEEGYIPTSERNFSSPRITELLKNGVLDCIGKKKCTYTNKMVSVFKLREGQTNIYDYI